MTHVEQVLRLQGSLRPGKGAGAPVKFVPTGLSDCSADERNSAPTGLGACSADEGNCPL